MLTSAHVTVVYSLYIPKFVPEFDHSLVLQIASPASADNSIVDATWPIPQLPSLFIICCRSSQDRFFKRSYSITICMVAQSSPYTVYELDYHEVFKIIN